MLPYIFRPTLSDFRKWCREYVWYSRDLIKTYESWPEIFPKSAYMQAKKITRQHKVFLASLDKKERTVLEETLMRKKPVPYRDKEKMDAFYHAYNNWKEICFPERKYSLKTISKEAVGAQIKSQRKKHGYSRALVADVLKISDATLKAYENGSRLLRLDIAYQLAQIYAVPLEQLVGL